MKLMSILPFLDQEDLSELIAKIKSKEVKGVSFTHLYPFLNSQEVDELVDLLVKEGPKKDLYGALPFMSKARLEKLHNEVKDGKVEGFAEEALLPFLGKDKIKDLVQDLINRKIGDKLDGLDDELSSKIEKAVEQAFGDDE